MTKQLNFSVTELAYLIDALSVSAATVRKDLDKSKNGLQIHPKMLQRELDLLEGMISQATTVYHDLFKEMKEAEKA